MIDVLVRDTDVRERGSEIGVNTSSGAATIYCVWYRAGIG